MSTLSVTNTFVAGNVIKASEQNQNFSDIVTWANGSIGNANFTTLTGTVTWAVTTNSLAASITNTGTEGSITVAHNGALASGKSAVKITSNSAQSAGTALLEINESSVSNAIPVVKITDAGSSNSSVQITATGNGGPALQVVSTTKPSHPCPSMTTTQRNALVSPTEGDEIYNSTNKRKELFDGTNWVGSSGPMTGTVVDYVGTSIPNSTLRCDGTAVSRTTYAALFAAIGTNWGVGDGSTTFNLPDLLGRATIGDGTGSGLTARTMADSGGEETHVLLAAELAPHKHFTVAAAHSNSGLSNSTQVAEDDATSTNTYALKGSNSGASEGLSGDGSGSPSNLSSTGHNNMQPFKVVKKVIVI